MDDRGIRIRSWGLGRFVPWDDVVSVSCEFNYYYRARLGMFAPVLHLTPTRMGFAQPTVKVIAMGSTSEVIAERRTAILAALVPKARVDGAG